MGFEPGVELWLCWAWSQAYLWIKMQLKNELLDDLDYCAIVLAVHSVPGHVEEDGCCAPDDSTMELLSPDHPEHVQENHVTSCSGKWINIRVFLL